MYYTDDPARDADRYFSDREKELDKLPECEECGWPIQSAFYYEINDTIICPDCLNHFKKRTEDYVR
jgi:formylmethanofuran dehydrogenase subunit E